MKCKREKNFAANQKFDRKANKKYGYPKRVNWFRAFKLMPWWMRWRVGQREINKIVEYEDATF